MTRASTNNLTSNSKKLKLLVFDSFPVQHHTPIWQALNCIAMDSIHVVYAAAERYAKETFEQRNVLDKSLLKGYSYTILSNKNSKSISSWNSLSSKGVKAIIQQFQPQIILLTSLNFRFNQVALWEAKKRKTPIYLRCETQDEAFPKTAIKKRFRSAYYKLIYRFLDRFYYIGHLNKQHYLNHGVKQTQLFPAHYFTLNPFKDLTEAQKRTQKQLSRTAYNFQKGSYIIGFSGKLIPQKNPEILFKMLDLLPEELRYRVVFYFMGSGESQGTLMNLASQYHEKYETRTIFTGSINPSQIAQHYLTMDMLILPSRQMGETWGLVVNEAMQAGCSVVVSNFVGCGADFKDWERFEVFQDNDAQDLANKVEHLVQYERDFDWANKQLQAYSLENCVEQLTHSLEADTLTPNLQILNS